jgi:anti-sigma B factor antagonist
MMMRIEQRMVGGVVVLSIRGDMTLGEQGATRLADRVRAVLQEGHDRLLLDLGYVQYVDSAGLGGLVQAYAATRNRGGVLKLVNATRRLHDLLVVMRVLTLFDTFDQESEALASFDRYAVHH